MNLQKPVPDKRPSADIPSVTFSRTDAVGIGFEIVALSDLYRRCQQFAFSISQPHQADFYQLLYVVEGKGCHSIDFRDYSYSSGDMLFISPEQVHAFDPRCEAQGYLLLFTESFVSKSLIHSDLLSMSRLYNYHTQSPILHQQELQTAGVEHLIKGMHQEFLHGPDYAKEDMLRLQLKMLLLKAERAKRAATVGTRNAEWVAWFRRYKLLIKEQYAQTRNAADYANSLGISYKHLNQICKSMVGMTAKGVIDNAIVLDIKKRLATTNVSIKTLTFDMGFDEPTNLVKFFKKKTGLTPAQFKQQLQG